MILSSPIKDKCFREWFSRPMVSNPEIYLILFRHQSCRCVEILFQCEIFCIRVGMTLVQVILSHEYGWFQCCRHEHSPFHRMFFSVFCNIHRRSFLSFSHSIIHPVSEWSGSHWQFWFCFVVSNDELLWPCSSLRYHNGLPRSITRYYIVHNGLRWSIVLGLLMKETRLGLFCLSPRGHNGLPRSIAHRSVSLALLRRPSFVIVPLWVACWERAFSWLFMIRVRHGFGVAAHNGLRRSILSLSLRAPAIFISIASLSELSDVEDDMFEGALAIRLIIGLDFAVTRSSPACSCFLFDIASRQLMELKWLILNKHNRWFPFHVWSFLSLECRQVGSWCRCTWFGFLGPNWFDRITNQAQLCGPWKHVSL